MKKLLLQQKHFAAVVVLFAVVAAYSAATQPTIPARMFDVRNGNGIVDSGVTYPQAIVIVFKDKAAKDGMIDAFAAQYNYPAKIADPANPSGPQIDNPQPKQVFMNRQLTAYLRDIYKAAQSQTATTAAQKTASDAADAKLPPN